MLNAMHTEIAVATHSPGDLVLKLGYVGDVELDQELELGISCPLLVVLVQLLAQGLPPVHPAHVVALAWILEPKVVNLQIEDAWPPRGRGRNRHRTGLHTPFKEICYTLIFLATLPITFIHTYCNTDQYHKQGIKH